MDDRTNHLDLPLPHSDHLMVEDVARLREALVSLDAVVSRRAHDSVEIAAGAGLRGGGTLQQSRNLAVAFASQEESETASASDVVMSPLRTAQAIEARLASEADAQAGEAAALLMTPLRTRQVLDGQLLARLASQVEAQAGEDAQRLMTPLRSHQAFDARLATRLATQQQAEAGLDGAQLMTPVRVAQYLAVQPKGEIQRVARTSNVKITAAEFGCFIDLTSGSFTQTFDPVAALGQGWFCYLRSSGTGDVTLDPNASETIDGLTSFIMYPGETRLLLCDGMALRSVVLSAFYKVFTTSGSFRKPPGYAGVMVEVIGAGTGGTGGSVVVMQGGSSGVRNGPAGGAHGPRRAPLFFASEELDATSTVVVGAGGSGGAGAPSIGSPTGAGGGAGGASTFILAQVLSSGSAGVPEISGLRRCAAAGGKSGDVSFNYSVINVTSGDTGSANVSGTALPQGGAGAKVIGNYATTYSNDVSSGTWSATGAAGQSAAVAFCSGAGGGPAACKVSADLNGPEPLILSLTGGNGGQGGLGAGGGAGGNAVIVRGTGGGWTDNVSATYTLRGGSGGNGGPGLVSVWGVI